MRTGKIFTLFIPFSFSDWIISNDSSSDSLILSLVLLSSLLTNHWIFHFSFHVLQLHDLYFVLFNIYIYIHFCSHCVDCGIIVPWPVTELVPLAVEVWSPITGWSEIALIFSLSFEILLCWDCSCFGLLPVVSIFMTVILNFLSGKLYSSVSLGFLDIYFVWNIFDSFSSASTLYISVCAFYKIGISPILHGLAMNSRILSSTNFFRDSGGLDQLFPSSGSSRKL